MNLLVYWGSPSNGKAFGTWIHGSDNISFYGMEQSDNITQESLQTIWEQWAVVYDGNMVSVYKNGFLVTKSFQTSLNTAQQILLLGKEAWMEDGFKGFIDDIRIYDRPLNAAEVQALNHVYDPQPPFVVDTTPDNGTSIGVSDNLTVRFSEGIDQSTLTSAFTLTRDNGTQVGIDNLTFDNASSPSR